MNFFQTMVFAYFMCLVSDSVSSRYLLVELNENNEEAPVAEARDVPVPKTPTPQTQQQLQGKIYHSHLAQYIYIYEYYHCKTKNII